MDADRRPDAAHDEAVAEQPAQARRWGAADLPQPSRRPEVVEGYRLEALACGADMSQPRTYPHGVPSWIDTEQPDPEAAQDFYQRLFGWAFATCLSAERPLLRCRQLGRA